MVRDLERERAHRAGALQQEGLAARAQVAGEQERHAPPVEPQHQGLVVGPWRWIRAGAEHGDERAAEPEALTGREHAAGHARPDQRGRGLRRAPRRAAALPELAHVEVGQDGGQAAGVIAIPVSERYRVEPGERSVPEEWRQHALSHVEAPGAAGPAVHQQSWPLRQLDERRVPLAHVEECHAEHGLGGSEPRPDRESRHQNRQGSHHGTDAPGGGHSGREEERAVPGDRRRRGRCGQVDHGGGQGARERDDPAQRDQHYPERVEEERGAGARDQLDQQREHTERGGDGGEGHHEQIGDHPDQRELIEVAQHERCHRGLRAEAHRHRRREPGRRAVGADPRGDARPEVDDAGGGREGQLEAGFPEIPGPPEQQGEHRECERVQELGLAIEQ